MPEPIYNLWKKIDFFELEKYKKGVDRANIYQA